MIIINTIIKYFLDYKINIKYNYILLYFDILLDNIYILDFIQKKKKNGKKFLFDVT